MKYNAVTVTQLNKYLKDRFDEDENLGAILVKGEISNFKNHYTGHLYFTLKDENSLIKCIMFKSYAERLAFKPKDGMKVMVFGSVSVFERDGVYQIYVKSMMEDGMGDLHEQFEQLKAKLEAEGLFDESHKKPIPLYPKVVGVLTSQTGAVIRDIINVSTRRNPNVYIRLLPVPVQGPGAAEKIAEKIKVARSYGDLSENSEYDDAKNEQAIMEARIVTIEATLKNAQIINESEVSNEYIHLASKVKVELVATGRVAEYKIVGSNDTDPGNGKISDESPVGKALMGHKKGDVVEAETPSGTIGIKILDIIK